MDTITPTLAEVVALALQLSPAEKVRLIQRLAARLRYDIDSSAAASRRSLLGMCADLGPAPTAEVINSRAWGNRRSRGE